MSVLLAIDDTDNEESIGTGRLARLLAEALCRKGYAEETSVTRHQLLVHPEIPYTSHNSSACIEAVSDHSPLEEIAAFAKAFLLENYHQGANPGLCLAEKERVPETLLSLGFRAQREVIGMAEAKAFAQLPGILTWSHGDTGQGIIGAMSGVALRRSGDDGRFISLKGIRDIGGVLTVGEIMNCTPIVNVCTAFGEALDRKEMVDTQDWVRPSVKRGQAVLLVVKDEGRWRPAEKRKKKNKISGQKDEQHFHQ